MDYIGIIVGLFVIATGVILGYYFSPRALKEEDIPEELSGALQKYSTNGFMEVPLAKKIRVTHDTYIFSFNLPEPDLPLGLHTGQHVAIHATLPTSEFPEGEQIRRKYTPISRVDQRGTFELMIKVYRANSHPKFPEGGVLSQYLETLNVGDKITISGPTGMLTYHGNGKVKIQRVEKLQHHRVKEIGLIAGGTGITPMYQIIKAILDNPNDPTKVHLLFGNRTEDDILIRPELEAAATDPRVKIYYTVDITNPEWKGFTGFVNKEMLQKTMPFPDKHTLICNCGPGPMTNMVGKQLLELGYSEEHIYKF